MLNRVTADRIVVSTNTDMQKVLDWYFENEDSLSKEPFAYPFHAGVIDFKEELMETTFELKNDLVEIVIYPLRVDRLKEACKAKESLNLAASLHVCRFDYDPNLDKVSNLKFNTDLPISKRNELMLVTMKDDTVGKVKMKYRALMLFTTHYQDLIHKEYKVHKNAQVKSKHGKKPKRIGQKTKLISKIYTFDVPDESVLTTKAKRTYELPKFEVKVRGHYRHYKNGKVIWINPYNKYKDKPTKRKEYEL